MTYLITFVAPTQRVFQTFDFATFEQKKGSSLSKIVNY